MAFGLLLALGLIDLGVLNFHLAPQLEAQLSPATTTAAPPTAVPTATPTAAVSNPLSTLTSTAVVAERPTNVAPSATLAETASTAQVVASTTPTTQGPQPSVESGKQAMPDIGFGLNSFQIGDAQALQDLKRLAEELKADPSKKLLLRGHSDSLGPPGPNQLLSHRRAAAVREYLIFRGVAADRVTIEAVGSNEPITDANNPAAWARNRRVQVLWQ